jgi:hypothetical protein
MSSERKLIIAEMGEYTRVQTETNELLTNGWYIDEGPYLVGTLLVVKLSKFEDASNDCGCSCGQCDCSDEGCV